ncbi:unnamed protein product [Linum trigynum]|uniref:Uncharacterized protein n=1 Tax=Linum trigynum TaxID=586398 RepID=A0AAV2D7U7_9ROSI
MITIPEKLGLGWEEQMAFFADNYLGLENSAKSKRSVKSQTSGFHETYKEASDEMVRQGNERTTGSDGRRA